MKIKLAVLLSLLLLKGISSFAEKYLVIGYIITNDSDTIYGKFEIKNPNKYKNLIPLHQKIAFINSDGDKVNIYPNSYKEYYFQFNEKQFLYEVIEIENILGIRKKIFLHREINGFIKKYIRYISYGTMDGTRYGTNELFKRSNSDEIIWKVNSRPEKAFRKEMMFLFEDNEEILNCINYKKPSKNDLDKLIREYNIWYNKYGDK